jgi:type IV secretory pathway VirB10-like protein
MKIVKSTEDLKRMALARGASASFGGAKFNSTEDRVSSRPIKPEPKPEPTPEPPKEKPPEPRIEQPKAVDLAPIVQAAVNAMAASVSDIAKDNARVMQEVMKAVERITAAPPAALATTSTSTVSEIAAKAWQLKVNRDTRGFMDTVDIKQIG